MCAYMQVFVKVCVRASAYACTQVCTCVNVHKCVDTCVCVLACVRVYTNEYACKLVSL